MIDNLHYIGEFKKSAIKVNKNTLFECDHLKQNDLFSTIKKYISSDGTITIFFHNVWSL